MSDDLIAEVFAKGPNGGPGGSCGGLWGSQVLISGDRGVPGGPGESLGRSSGALGGQEAMGLIVYGEASGVAFCCF